MLLPPPRTLRKLLDGMNSHIHSLQSSQSHCLTCGGHHHTCICDRDTDTPQLPQHTPSSDATTSKVSRPWLNPMLQHLLVHHLLIRWLNHPTLQRCMLTPARWFSSKSLRQKLPTHRTPPALWIWALCLMWEARSHNYLTQRVKNALELPLRSKWSLSIAAFGSRKGRFRQCEVVRLSVRTRHGDSQILKAFFVPYICNPGPQLPAWSCMVISLSCAWILTRKRPCKLIYSLAQISTGNLWQARLLEEMVGLWPLRQLWDGCCLDQLEWVSRKDLL